MTSSNSGARCSELQRIVGDHFASAQGGRFASARVAAALARLEAEGVTCVGQSSWGPTGFAVVESEAVAAQAVALLEKEFAGAGLVVRRSPAVAIGAARSRSSRPGPRA